MQSSICAGRKLANRLEVDSSARSASPPKVGASEHELEAILGELQIEDSMTKRVQSAVGAASGEKDEWRSRPMNHVGLIVAIALEVSTGVRSQYFLHHLTNSFEIRSSPKHSIWPVRCMA